jgi:hypothetical protein
VKYQPTRTMKKHHTEEQILGDGDAGLGPG